MITFMDSKDKVEDSEKCLDSLLWHACAGGMVKMPPLNSKVYYFPQGHAEHAISAVDFRSCPRILPYILCRVASTKFMADPETDEVFAKIRLLPLSQSDPDFGDGSSDMSDGHEKPASFAKTLTQSDANNGGGFSVPRYCAETIFPRLDYSADPPVQTILAKDVHGEIWKFRHIYRGTPRRHLLTTGWSTFVNRKKLVAGDSIVFLRAENGDLCVGIRRAKRGGGVGGGRPELSPGWMGPESCFNGFSAYLDKGKIMSANGHGNRTSGGMGKLKPDSVVEAAKLAASGQPFEVVYYPRAGTPEFFVKASVVKASMQIRWYSGMRFKMAFETEDSSRISWFMGTISSVQVADPLCWPDSPWRLLQVTWDEPELLQNVKRVSPWLVELVSSIPAMHLSPFSPSRKKPRLLHHLEFPFDASQFPSPPFIPGGTLMAQAGPLGCIPNNTPPASMQGARHAHLGLPHSDLRLNRHHPGTPTPSRASSGSLRKPSSDEDVSCLLTKAYSNSNPGMKKSEGDKTLLVLFGRTILPEPQISLSCSGDAVSPVCTKESSSEGNADRTGSFSNDERPRRREGRFRLLKNDETTEPHLEMGHCKVFVESEDVGRTLDLSSLGSYDELCKKVGDMFGLENHDTLSNMLYRDVSGTVRSVGQEAFSDFAKSAKRLTILADSNSDNVERR